MEKYLAGLNEGDSARVTMIAHEGAMRGRLIDLGLIEGTCVKCVQKSASGELAAYVIRGAVIALRREDANKILCN